MPVNSRPSRSAPICPLILWDWHASSHTCSEYIVGARGTAATYWLGFGVRIPLRVRMSVSSGCCFLQTEFPVTVRSLFQRSPTECGVSLVAIKWNIYPLYLQCVGRKKSKCERKKNYDLQLYHWREEKCVKGFGGKPEGKRNLGKPTLRWDDNIKMYLQETGCGAWTGFIWLRTRTYGRLFWTWWLNFRFHEIRGPSRLSKEIVCSQEWLCLMEFGSLLGTKLAS